MEAALQIETGALYTRHAAAADRGSWSVVKDVRWGDIDVPLAQSQQEVLLVVRRTVLALSERGARTARLLSSVADDPHASAALTLDLWEGLKHLHALRSYLDTVDFAPRMTDAEITAARAGIASPSTANGSDGLIGLLFIQHLTATSLRYLGARAAEPVLAELLAFIAADEARQAQIVGDLLALQIRTGVTTAGEVQAAAAGLKPRSQDGPRMPGWPADDLAVQTFLKRVESLCG